MKPSVIYIESNTSGTGRLFVSAASELGFRPVVVTQDPSRYPYLQTGIDWIEADTRNADGVLPALSRLAESAPVAGILSSSEYYVAVAAELAQRCGLPGADAAAIRACRNKFVQRQRLLSAGVRVPRFGRVDSVGESVRQAAALGPQVIVKPLDRTGSIGVRLCRGQPEVSAHAGRLLRQTTNERGVPVEPGVLIEEYLQGPEYSVETFDGTVIGITRKHLSREPLFVETGHDFPAALEGDDALRVERIVVKAVRALGLHRGPAHTELRLTNHGPAIIEVNPRLAGGFIPELVRLASGIDLVRETVRCAIGSPPDLLKRCSRFASIRFLCVEQPGRIADLQGVADALQVGGVARVETYIRAGQETGGHGDFRDRIAHVIASGSSLDDAAGAAAAGLLKLRVLTVSQHREGGIACKALEELPSC